MGRISRNSIGTWIRSIHFMSPVLLLLVVSLAKYKITKYCLIYCLITSFMFLYFQECYLSKIEQFMLNDDVYAVDLSLEVFNVKITKQSRFIATIIFGSLIYIIVFAIFYKRFFT